MTTSALQDWHVILIGLSKVPESGPGLLVCAIVADKALWVHFHTCFENLCLGA